MKKLIAILLAVLMLGSATAWADEAFVLADPVLEVTVEGEDEPMSLDLTGLALVMGGDSEKQRFAVNLIGQDELLFAASAQLDGDRLLIGIDGLSKTYCVTVPENAPVSTDGNLSVELDPAILEAVLSEVELDFEGDSILFRLPYTAVYKLLQAIRPSLEDREDAQELLDQLDQMEAEGSGVELSGSLKVADGTEGQLLVQKVEKGVVAEQPILQIDFSAVTGEEDGLDFSARISTEEEGSLQPVLGLEGSVNNQDEDFTADVTVLSYENGESEVAALVSLASDDTAFRCEVELPETLQMGVSYDKAEKLVRLYGEAEGLNGSLSAHVTTEERELSYCEFDAANAVDLQNLSEEEQAAFREELQGVLTPVISYLMPVLMG